MTDEHEYNQYNVNITLDVSISNRWAPTFLGFLNEIYHNSDIGYSSLVGFFADGDGDFRFKVDMPTDKNKEFVYEFDIDDYEGTKKIDFVKITERPMLDGSVFRSVENIYDAG